MNLRYTPAAVADLRNLRNYLTNEFGAEVARKALAKLVSDISSLKDLPGLIRPLEDIIQRKTPYQYFLCGKYSVAILLNDDSTISVIRIFDERSDFILKIFGDL